MQRLSVSFSLKRSKLRKMSQPFNPSSLGQHGSTVQIHRNGGGNTATRAALWCASRADNHVLVPGTLAQTRVLLACDQVNMPLATAAWSRCMRACYMS